MKFKRSSGILMHPTSFPGPYGIGDLGKAAYDFVDFLAESGQHLWQVMPLGPTGFGDSPYASFSAFAGNHCIISFEELAKEGLLDLSKIETPKFPDDKVNFDDVIKFKNSVLKVAFENFMTDATGKQRSDMGHFCHENAWWLDDYSLFMALKGYYNNNIWNTWADDLVRRDHNALHYWHNELKNDVAFHKFLQYEFYRQWFNIKEYANSNEIQIIGDIPIFVAYDSADVWSNQHLFYLDENRNSTVVAGVPPDVFSKTGQRWGNPLYRWDVMQNENYDWWVKRFSLAFATVDIIRIDHFRGFEAYWEIPGTAPTAEKGRWVKGPNKDLFYNIEHRLGKLPIIAEDLGVITPEVEDLRDTFQFPGMKILQFAFSGPTNPYLPHNFESNCVVYTGTHDNDTTVGWFKECPDDEKKYVLKYLGTDGKNISWDLIKLAMSSVADLAIFPMQDVLGIGTEGRMNLPGKEDGNWGWRFTFDLINDKIKDSLKDLAIIYGRHKVEIRKEQTL